MYKRKCQICNNDFETKKQNQKNCITHKGLKKDVYTIISEELYRKCIKCLNFKKISDFYSKTNARCNSWCKECFNQGAYTYQSDRAIVRKLELIKKAGGCCSVCGYKKNLSCLVFHHTDPSKKEFNLDARTIANNSIEVITKEFDKCIVMCHNCHTEYHNPQFNDLL